MIKEYELKIDAKKQNLDFLRNLISHNTQKQQATEGTANITQMNEINNSNILNSMNIAQTIIIDEEKIPRGSFSNIIKYPEIASNLSLIKDQGII